MNKTILISITIEELQSILIDCINACLKYNKSNCCTQPKKGKVINKKGGTDA